MSDVDIGSEAVENYAECFHTMHLLGSHISSGHSYGTVAAMLRALRTELTATQEKLAAAEKYADLMAQDNVNKQAQLTTAQAQIDAARNEGLDLAIAHFRSTFINNRTIGRVLAELEALKSTAPVRDDARDERLIKFGGDEENWLHPSEDRYRTAEEILAAFNTQDNSNE